MRTHTVICKHCNTPYSHYLSGNNIPEYNDETYCPTCKKIIEDALSNVPVAYNKELRKIELPEHMWTLFNMLKEDYLKSYMFNIKRVIHGLEDKEYDGYIHDGREFLVITDTKTGEREVQCYVYQSTTDCDDYIFVSNNDIARYIPYENTKFHVESDLVTERQLDEPSNKLLYIDFQDTLKK